MRSPKTKIKNTRPEPEFSFKELVEYARPEDALSLVRLMKEASIRRQDFEDAQYFREVQKKIEAAISTGKKIRFL